MSSRFFRCFNSVVVLSVLMLAHHDAGAEPSTTAGASGVISLVEVDPPGGVVVELPEDRRWFEIRLSGWAPSMLEEWQAKIDPDSFLPTAEGYIALAQEPCCSDELCEFEFGTGATCNMAQGLCTPGFRDATRFNWLFDAPSGPLAPPYLAFSGTTDDVSAPLDNGTQLYGGTIVIDPTYTPPPIPVAFPIDFLPAPDSFMTDRFGAPLPSTTQSGAVVLPGASCCFLFNGTCQDNVTEPDCALRGGLWRGSDRFCSSGCNECSMDAECNDSDVCTVDECNPSGCFHTPWYDARTECCDPSTGSTFGDADARFDPCMRIVCNTQAHTFLFEPLPPGSACDDGDICTRRTFCNTAGKCVGSPNPGVSCTKNRFASFAMDELLVAGCSDQRAVRVTFVDINGFESFNGETRWLGTPGVFPEIGVLPDGVSAAETQCDPHFDNFGSPGLIHMYGAGIVPDSTYEVQSVDQTCPDLDDPSCYSPPLTIRTGVWGDIAKPFAATTASQPTFVDISALVGSFLGSANAPSKVRAQLQPNTPAPAEALSFKDIAASVSAFLGEPYPFDGPAVCP